MEEDNYNPEQKKAVEKVMGLVNQLVELEDLQRRAHQPIYRLSCAIDQTISDISLDNLPSYHILEGRLRKAVQEAVEIPGLKDDSYIMEIRDLAFS